MASLPLPSPSSSPPPPHGRWHHLLPYLSICTSIRHLKQIHAQSLKCLLNTAITQDDHLFLYSRLVHLSTTAFADLHYATLLLHHHPLTPNSFIWNTLIAAHSRTSHLKHVSFHLYLRMLSDGRVLPDKHTFPFVLKACAFLFLESEGAQVQAQVLKFGLWSDIYVNNSLVHFYASCGQLENARKVFDGMLERSFVSWNVMIDGCVRCSEFDAALGLYREMQKKGFQPDGYTVQSAAYACGALAALSTGIWVHAYFLRKCSGDLFNDVLVCNSLLDMYCKCGRINLARQLFERMPVRDVVSWNCMILGFATHGLVEESLSAFSQMTEVVGLRPNSITFIGVLTACNHGGFVNKGKQYFRLMVREFSVKPQMEHYGCIIDLLARAGCIDEALDIASGMPFKPDAIIWRSLLDACLKRNTDVDIGESLTRRVFESEDRMTSGAFVLLSKIYAATNRWNDVGVIRGLMSEGGIKKEPGCSLIEIDDSVHEFFAGDTSHPRSEEIYSMLKVLEQQFSEACKPFNLDVSGDTDVLLLQEVVVNSQQLDD